MKSIAAKYQEQFNSMNPESVLQLIHEKHPGKFVFSSSMGAEDQVITHMLTKITGSPPIFTLDTGRLFYETYDLIEKTNKRYGISIQIVFPDTGRVEEMVGNKGINLFYQSVEDRRLCCQIRKTEPLQRALKDHEVWVTGLRREQSPTRYDLRMAEWDETNRIIKVNPLLEWTEAQVWDYIETHNIPYNALHKKGYPSLGCQPCTRAIMPGEDIRAGRWWWEQPQSKECGLHVSNHKK